ncbi:hypothetical protein HZS55_22025 [Halosimplex rubrum]|uniref:Uncharacterized protein n=1 Tax=Halosimplex rubrum TaxID=869889 RepID=A0A7D5P366_9EURY|nr:hypothetical protein [Halosimplex rubrum]QLH79806.1 hypothetical protein HZS55_22025 [Halosimplex rubrum]
MGRLRSGRWIFTLLLLLDSLLSVSDEFLTATVLGSKAVLSLSGNLVGELDLVMNGLVLGAGAFLLSERLFTRAWASRLSYRLIFTGSSFLSYLVLVSNIGGNTVVFFGAFPIVVQWIVNYVISVFGPYCAFAVLFSRCTTLGSPTTRVATLRLSAVVLSATMLFGTSFFVLGNFLPVFELVTAIGLLLESRYGNSIAVLGTVHRLEQSIATITQHATTNIQSYTDAVLVYAALFTSSLVFTPTILDWDVLTVFFLGAVEAIATWQLTLAAYLLLGGVSIVGAVVGSVYLLWYWGRVLIRLPSLGGLISIDETPVRPRVGVVPGVVLISGATIWRDAQDVGVYRGRLGIATPAGISELNLFALGLIVGLLVCMLYWCVANYRATMQYRPTADRGTFAIPLRAVEHERAMIALSFLFQLVVISTFVLEPTIVTLTMLGPFWLFLGCYLVVQVSAMIDDRPFAHALLVVGPVVLVGLFLRFGILPFQTLPIISVTIGSTVLLGLSSRQNR